MTYDVAALKFVEKPVSTSFADVSNRQDYFITPKAAKDIFDDGEKVRERKGKRLGWIVSIAALATAGVVFIVMRGLPKSAYKWISELSKKFEKRSAKRKVSGHNKLAKFYENLSKCFENFAAKSKSINNVTSFKDLAFKKLFFLLKFAKKIYDSITSIFEKLAVGTVSKKYRSSEKTFSKLFSTFTKTNKKLLAQNPNGVMSVDGAEVTITKAVEDIIKAQTKSMANLESGFSKSQRAKRLTQMHEYCKDLDKRVLEAGIGDISKAKGFKSILEAVKDAPITNKFVAADCLANDKAKLLSEIKDLVSRQDASLSEVLELYKQVLPQKEYAKLVSKVKNAMKKLDKAANMEGDRFFDKLRDLTLGSAPTDVLSILSSLVGVGVGLSVADNKDERVSATLKYGIPIVGSVATSVAMTVSLVSGIWSMLVGTTSGLVMNRVGKSIDKNYQLKQKQRVDNEHTEAIKAEASSVEKA